MQNTGRHTSFSRTSGELPSLIRSNLSTALQEQRGVQFFSIPTGIKMVSRGPAPTKEMNDQENDRDDKKQVNESRRDMENDECPDPRKK
jgi:hypothetical protein